MSLTTRMLVALIAGLVTGIVATTVDDAAASAIVRVTDPVGSIWVNALRMTLIPLVVSLLIGVIASVPSARSTGKLGIRALVTFVILLGATGVVSILIGPALGVFVLERAGSTALWVGSFVVALVSGALLARVKAPGRKP